MPNWKILVTDGLEEIGLTLLRAACQVDDRRGIEMTELLHIIPGYEALIVRGRTKVTAEVIEASERLKVIGRAGVGVDNIDLEAARARHICVVNSPSALRMRQPKIDQSHRFWRRGLAVESRMGWEVQ